MLAYLHRTNKKKKALSNLHSSTKTAEHCLRLGVVVVSGRVTFSWGEN